MTDRSQIEYELLGAAVCSPGVTHWPEWQSYTWADDHCAWLSGFIARKFSSDPHVTMASLALSLEASPEIADLGGPRAYLESLASAAIPNDSVREYLALASRMATHETLRNEANELIRHSDQLDPAGLASNLETLSRGVLVSLKSGPSRWRIIGFNEADSIKRRSDYLIKGLLFQGDLVALYGPSASGKSFVALDIAMSIARGVGWNGRRSQAFGVAYVVAEGQSGFSDRVAAYGRRHGVVACANLQMIHGAPNLAGITPDVSDLCQCLRQASTRMDDSLGLVVIDTVARVIPGQNENAFETMSALIDAVAMIQREFGVTVLLVHHSGKDKDRGMRGHSSLFAACDTVIEVSPPDIDGAAAFKVTKQKDGDQDIALGFQLEDVALGWDEDGAEIFSCVVSYCETPLSAFKQGRTHADRALEALRAACLSSALTDPATGVPAASHDQWRAEFLALEEIRNLKPDTASTAFRRGRDQAISDGAIFQAGEAYFPADYVGQSDAA